MFRVHIFVVPKQTCNRSAPTHFFNVLYYTNTTMTFSSIKRRRFVMMKSLMCSISCTASGKVLFIFQLAAIIFCFISFYSNVERCEAQKYIFSDIWAEFFSILLLFFFEQEEIESAKCMAGGLFYLFLEVFCMKKFVKGDAKNFKYLRHGD